VSAIAQPQVEDDVQAWLNREISEGRLSAAPSPEALRRIAAMLTGPVAQPRVVRIRPKPLAPAQPQVPADEVGDLPVVDISDHKSRRKTAPSSP